MRLFIPSFPGPYLSERQLGCSHSLTTIDLAASDWWMASKWSAMLFPLF